MTNYSYKDLTDKDVGTITGDSLVTVAALNSENDDAKKIKVRNVAGALTEQRTISVVTTLITRTLRQDEFKPLSFQSPKVNTGRTNLQNSHINIVQTGFYMVGFVINYYCPTFHKNGNFRVQVRDYNTGLYVIDAWSAPKIEATVGTTDVVTNGVQSSKFYHVPSIYATMGIQAASSEANDTVTVLGSSIFYMYKVF